MLQAIFGVSLESDLEAKFEFFCKLLDLLDRLGFPLDPDFEAKIETLKKLFVELARVRAERAELARLRQRNEDERRMVTKRKSEKQSRSASPNA